MSKICGVWYCESRPASAEDAARVRSALNRPGYGSAQEHSDAGLIMGWAAGSHAPRGVGIFRSSSGNVCLWDGRLDNRGDLLRQTGLRPDASESALLLALYQQKGVDGLGDAIGDWSLCIWDPGRREITLASDFAGIRPLYYHMKAGCLRWSSSLADLVQWTGVTELDEQYVSRFLAHGSAPARTPYAGILAVPAGQAIGITRERVAKRAFWSLPIHRETRYRDERQYEEQLLEHFRDAVRGRIANRTMACAELSGGLDSSSVVCMASRLRQELPVEIPEIATFSYTHENCQDERFFLEVERACEVKGCHLQVRDSPAVTCDRAAAVPTWWEPRFRELAGRMDAMGSGVLLTGQFGDFVMGNTADDSIQVAGWLAKGRLLKAAREAYAWGRAMQTPLYPILWRSVREAWFGWVPPVDPRAAVGAIQASREDSLSSSLRARLEENPAEDAPWRDAPPGRRQRFRAAGEVLRGRALQTPEALQHLSCAHPYAHRPLLEFMLTIPAGIVVRPDQPRRLMRRAFAGLLPPLVLNRKSKAAYTAAYRDSLLPLAAALLRRPSGIQIVERGYADRGSLIGRLEKFTQGLDCNEGQLRSLLLFEFWLQNRMAAVAPASV